MKWHFLKNDESNTVPFKVWVAYKEYDNKDKIYHKKVAEGYYSFELKVWRFDDDFVTDSIIPNPYAWAYKNYPTPPEEFDESLVNL